MKHHPFSTLSLLKNRLPRLALMLSLVAAILFSAGSVASAGGQASRLLQSSCSTVRVDAGSTVSYTDGSGNVWSADSNFTGGSTVNRGAISVSNTSDPTLYQTEHYSMSSANFSVANCSYTVTLKFAETYFTSAGQRVFNVAINGSTVLTNFDPFADSGANARADDKSFVVTVTNGVIAINFTAVTNNPEINAIQIVPSSGSPTNTPSASCSTYRVDAGSTASYTDGSGNVWSADSNFTGGSTVNRGAISVSNTSDPTLYQTEHYSMSSANFSVANCTYSVTLKFAETYFTSAGQRVFNVAINGSTVLTNFDPFADSGGNARADDKSFVVTVTNGVIAINFTAVTNNPEINAIQIVPNSGSPTNTPTVQAPTNTPVSAPTNTPTLVKTNTPIPATNTPTVQAPTNTPVSGGGLTTQIQAGGTDNNQQTAFNFYLKNTGTSALSNVTARIYFTLNGSNTAATYVLEKYYDQSGVATISGPTQCAASTTYYFTVNYGSASLAAGAAWQFQTSLHLSTWANTYDGSIDWFHTGYAVGALPGAATNTNYIPGYVNGALSWGSLPNCGSGGATNTPVPPTATFTLTPGGPTATRTNTPQVTSQPPTNTPIVTPSGPTATPPPVGTHLANPFAGALWYVNPYWAAEVNGSNVTASQKAIVSKANTFVWLDSIASVNGTNGYPTNLAGYLDGAESQGANLIGLVIYDLPGRDCSALASNGELPATTAGLQTYETSYIDVIASTLSQAKYNNLRIVLVIEPDSLPNMVTNLSVQACSTVNSLNLYPLGVEYALNKLHAIVNVYNYLDIGHSGWLGWPNNFNSAITLYTNLLKATTASFASVDGYISNTANNQVVNEPFMTATQTVGGQPVNSVSFYSYDPYIEEDTYDQAWATAIKGAGAAAGNANMLVDTSRNGWGGCGGSTYVTQNCRPTGPSTATDIATFVTMSRIDRRPARGDWCNQNGAGLGQLPQARPSGDIYQAYVWVKPPGESDGSSSLIPPGPNNPGGKGFDQMCDPAYMGNAMNQNMNTNALPNAPVSGAWFEVQFEQLVANAYPPLSGATTPVPTNTPVAATPTPTATPSSGAATNGPYHVTGNTIYDQSNVVHRLHGVDRSGLEVSCSDPTMTQQDFNTMRTWNANVVRIALNQDYWLSGANRFCASYASNVNTVFNYATSAGMDVIFDLHWNDACNLGNSSPGQQMMADCNSLTFWQQFAGSAAYKNNPHVIFEMYNEPHDISWACWLNGCTTSAGWQAVGMQQIYNTIRGTGANNLVLAGGLNWGYDLTGVPANRISGVNIAYVTHPYDFSGKQPADWDTNWGFLTATDPVVVTEFGDFNCTSGYYSSLISYAQAHNATSWTAWAWTASGCNFPSLLSNANGTPSNPVGTTVQSALLAMPPN